MIPRNVLLWLSNRPGPVGAHAAAYREWRWGDCHVRLLRALCDRRLVSIDVGAHAGAYTWFLRRFSARCIAFEPNPRLAAALRRRFPRGVDVRATALSDQPGSATLRIPLRRLDPEPARATIEQMNALDDMSGVHEAVTVAVETLDRAVQERVGFIKIDVEGHELKVLQGAERILRQDRPNLILELEDRHNPGIVAAAFAALRARGYHGWFWQPEGFLPVEAFELARHQSGAAPDAYANNFIFSGEPSLGGRLRL